jgi:hypothetical protein
VDRAGPVCTLPGLLSGRFAYREKAASDIRRNPRTAELVTCGQEPAAPGEGRLFGYYSACSKVQSTGMSPVTICDIGTSRAYRSEDKMIIYFYGFMCVS